MPKKFNLCIGIIISMTILMLAACILVPIFDEEEAHLAVGDIYDINDGWSMSIFAIAPAYSGVSHS